MATIRNLGLIAQLRSETSRHVIRYRNGRVRQSGRGLVFWFRPETASISEVPVDDREMTLFVRGRSRDFQTVVVQGTVGWHVVVSVSRHVDRNLSGGAHAPAGSHLEGLTRNYRTAFLRYRSLFDALLETEARDTAEDSPSTR